MEKGWSIGIVAGLLVSFLIFTAGFYSGNQITGQHRADIGEIEPATKSEVQKCVVVSFPTASSSDGSLYSGSHVCSDHSSTFGVERECVQAISTSKLSDRTAVYDCVENLHINPDLDMVATCCQLD